MSARHYFFILVLSFGLILSTACGKQKTDDALYSTETVEEVSYSAKVKQFDIFDLQEGKTTIQHITGWLDAPASIEIDKEDPTKQRWIYYLSKPLHGSPAKKKMSHRTPWLLLSLEFTDGVLSHYDLKDLSQ